MPERRPEGGPPLRVLHVAAAAGLIAAATASGCGGGSGTHPAAARTAAATSDRAPELARLRREIAADARRRGREPVRRVSCTPTTRAGAPPGTLDCLAVTHEARRSRTIPIPVALGQPYTARIDPRTGRGGWCRITPVAGEGATPKPDQIRRLPARCGGS